MVVIKIAAKVVYFFIWNIESYNIILAYNIIHEYRTINGWESEGNATTQ